MLIEKKNIDNYIRVRKLSKTTEKLSKTMLNGVGIVTGSVVKPMVRSGTGKAFMKMVPGEVLLASLDAVSKSLTLTTHSLITLNIISHHIINT